MSDLYPLRFESILKERVWGGESLKVNYNKTTSLKGNIGESWEISSVPGDISVVSNGFLAGNTLEELIEVYMGDITGDSIYDRFGIEFPLLIKLIESKQNLSIQVHPGNELAKKRHNAYGKTEMWYILENEPEAQIYTGLRDDVKKEDYLKAINNCSLPGLMNMEPARKGDFFFTPAGRIHAIGAGLTLVEIQQTSDITYRIYDWSRTGTEKRELHTDLALDAIDFNATGESSIKRKPVLNSEVNITDNEFFTTNIVLFDKTFKKEYYFLDSFVIYLCTDGSFTIKCEGHEEILKKGDTVLVPAMIKEVIFETEEESCFLEIYINESTKLL